MKRLTHIAVLFLLLFPVHAAASTITVAITRGEQETYERFLEEKGGEPLAITNFTSDCSTRPVVNLVLLQQALALGGSTAEISYQLVPNYCRAIHEVKTGNAVVISQDAWDDDFDESVFKSAPIIRRGEFRKAIYGLKTNRRLMSATTLADFHRLTALTGLKWSVDIKTLRQMNVSKLVLAPKYDLHFKMVMEGRADFGLLESSNPGYLKGPLPEQLDIVEGVTVGLAGSRHFMVSRKHPLGQEVFEALNRGIAILRERGMIRQALTECGFINPILERWKLINP